MSYFIFSKNLNNVIGTLYRIAENQSDLNNLNITQSEYKIIEDSQNNFNSIKYQTKKIISYNNDIITYENHSVVFEDFINSKGEVVETGKKKLENYINNFKILIKQFTDNNINHFLYNLWNNYYNQFNSLNLNSIQFPLNKSLEQYFNDSGQLSLNPLQLP